ncbi:bacterial Ig-like domain protein [Clostridium saccharobutylicum]|uniref:Ig-like domain-containing protein n=1 Tax=Clostridium saccharobutylicum TaxID=169679 RepID=UPI000983F546|nr:Ig-like domain-containing protein [Clostridium saccharobutylicum]AQS09698.1 bacterial Ig-like domain protein [Clostridium saccharobutylicum]MBC2436908.1 Ig domain-containing protein [Clostridium saccharobutylicum]NSB89256.1 uncharacterized protein YjdB [Clostridium saccharobutylicum]NYC27910.1 uncharacterized protein YjdB [Clostridium saccharobutylicum]OOM17107.1 bacterial Ig-like domain protein [Clostridium saccharobutylicum]
MKNYFKKFSIMFVMALILILGSCVSVFASDDAVTGTNNLNGTAENSAVVGNQLTTAEKGWKRYDDTDSRFLYNNVLGNWATWSDSTRAYNGSAHYYRNADSNGKVTFKFYGSKLRIISPIDTNKSSNIIIDIDGIQYNFNEYGTTLMKALVFEKLGLTMDIHVVNIYKSNIANDLCLDAIDIDDNGYLVNLNESISLNNSNMDLTVGSSGQLTATTTPSGAQVTWASDNTGVATVDSNGKVTGVSEGTCTITAKTADGLIATCIVTVTKKDDSQPTTPTQPTGDANLFIELVDGQIKQYNVSQDEINKFTTWFENRDKDHSLSATYKFTKGTYTDYVVHDQVDWFEIR